MAGTPLNISLKVTGIDQAKADLQLFGATGKRSFEDIRAASEKLTANAATTNSAMRAVATSVRGIAAAVDPLTAASIKLSNQYSILDRALKANIVSGELHKKLTDSLSRSYEVLAFTTAKAAAQGDALTQHIAKLTAKFDPAAAAAKKMADEIDELNEAQMRGVNIAGGYDVALKKIRDSYNGTAEAAKKTAKEEERLAVVAQKHKDVLDPLSAATRTYQKAVDDVRKATAAGHLTATQQEIILGRLSAAHDAASTNIKKMELNSRQMGYVLTNLSFQVNDVVTGLVSGQPTFQVFAQQAGQIYQIFTQGGGFANVMKNVASSIIGMITPMRLAMVGFAALGAVAIKTALDVAGTRQRITEYNATLNAMGSGGGIASVALDQLRQRLENTGLSAQQAGKMIDAVTRTSNINPVAAPQITAISRDLGATLAGTGEDRGEKAVEIANQYTKAISEGTEATIKFAQSLFGPNGLTVAQIQQAVAADRAGNIARAQTVIYEELVRRAGGNWDKLRTDTEKATDSIGAAWAAMWKAMEETQTAHDFEGWLTGQLREIEQIFKGNGGKVITDAWNGILTDLKSAWDNMWDTLAKDRAVQAVRNALPSNVLPQATDPNNTGWQESARRQQEAGTIAGFMERLHGRAKTIDEGVIAANAKAAARATAEAAAEAARIAEAAAARVIEGGAIKGAVGSLTDDFVQSTSAAIAKGLTEGLSSTEDDAKAWAKKMGDEMTLAIGVAAAGSLKVGGAIGPGATAAATGSMSIPTAGVLPEFAQRVNAWLASLSPEDRALIRITSGYRSPEQQAALFGASDKSGRMVAAPGGSAHGYGIAYDIQGMSAAARASLGLYGLHTPMPWEPWHVEPSGTSRADQATAAQRRQSFAVVAGGMSSGLTGAGAPAVGPTVAPSFNPSLTLGPSFAVSEADARQRAYNKVVQDTVLMTGIAAKGQEAYNASLGAQMPVGEAVRKADEARAHAIAMATNEAIKNATAQDTANKSSMDAARIASTDVVAGYQATARAQAEAKERAGEITDVNAETQRILATNVAATATAAAAAIPTLRTQAEVQEKLIEQTLKGGAAAHDAEVQAKVTAATNDLANQAKAAGIPLTEKNIAGIIKETEALIRRNAAGEARIQLAKDIAGESKQIDSLRLQASLQGQSTEQIQTQVELQKIIQDALEKNISLEDELLQKRLRSAVALGKAREELVAAQRAQAKWEDTIRSIASTIESELSGAVEKALSGEKAEAWGAKMKRVLNSALSGLTASLFIRPLLGTVAGGLGAPSTAQSLGSFGSMLGGAGNLFGGAQTITSPSGSVIGTIGNSGGGMLGTLGSEIGLTGSGGFFGGGLGGIFASTSAPATTLGSWSTAAGGVSQGLAPGSLFGTTTLGSAVGGIGAGFGAGMLTNSLLGGNQTGGMAGSMVGSLAGMAIGSMIGMPFLGALLGGAGGGMFGGMFGNSRPSNASAGGTLDLASGRITGGFAGGNAQIDQDTRQVITSVAAVTEALMSVSGKLEGNLLIQGGVNTGFTADSTLPGFSGRFSLGKDPVRAAEMIALALSQSVTGVSDTVRTVLDQTKSLEDIVGNLQFAQIYDSIKIAAEDAFSSVEDATRRAGPFELAMNAIETTFADITTKATQFGLALEPVNAALEEATRRLQDDFVNAIDMAFNEASGSGFLNQIQATFDQYAADIREAQEIGLTYEAAPQVHHDLGQVFTEQIQNILDTLTEAQLDEVIAEFGDLNAVIDDLAASTEGVVLVTEELVAAQERAAQLTQATDQIQAFIDALLATPSPSVSPEAALAESRTQFAEQLALAQGGDMDALLGITESADQLVRNIHTFFASSEAGQVEIARVIEQLTALQQPGGVGTADPAVITNDLLASIDETTQSAASTASSGLVVGQATQTLIDRNLETANRMIDRNEELAAAAIEANFGAAETAIEGNLENTDRLIAQGNEVAEARAAYERDQNLALIAANDTALTNTLAQMDQEHTALLSDATAQTAAITAKHDEVTAFILDDAKTRTDQLVAQQIDSSEAGLAETKAQTTALTDQLKLDAEAFKLESQTQTASLSFWGGALYQRSVDNAVYLGGIIGAWGESLYTQIASNALHIGGVTAAWGEAQVYATNNSSAAIMNTDAAWSKHVADVDYLMTVSQMVNDTNLANSQIQKAQDMGKWITDTVGWWTGTQMQNDTGLANSIIQTGAQYGSSTTSAVYNAANSMISVDTELGNSTVRAVAKLEATNVNYFTGIMYWLEGINRSSHEIGQVAERQRNTMIQTLTWILNQLKIMALGGGGYYPEYATGD